MESQNEIKAKEFATTHDGKIIGFAHIAALQMAQWKDEQFQKVLDYAEICYGVFSFEQRKNFINHIKDIFYGKE